MERRASEGRGVVRRDQRLLAGGVVPSKHAEHGGCGRRPDGHILGPAEGVCAYGPAVFCMPGDGS